MHIRLLATVGLLFLTGSLAEAQEKYSLRPKHEVGHVLDYQLSLETLTKLKTLGDEAQRSQVVLQSQVETTAERGTAHKRVNLSFLNFKGQVNLYGQTLNLDSDHLAEVPPILQQVYGGILDRKISLLYDAQDRLVSSGDEAGDQAPPLGQGSGLLGKQLADMHRLSGEVAVPPRDVAVGESWEVSQRVDIGLLGEMLVTGSATLAEVLEVEGQKMAKITAKLQLALASSDAEQVPLMTLDASASKIELEVLFRLSDQIAYRQTSLSVMSAQFNGNGAYLEQKSVNQWLKTTESKP